MARRASLTAALHGAIHGAADGARLEHDQVNGPSFRRSCFAPGTRRPSAVSPDVGEDDGDKLLPGEASSAHSGDVDDARRWFETYAELCRLKQQILTDLTSLKVRVPPEGDAEVKDDEAMLSAEYERLRERREFWQAEFEARQDR